MYSNNIPKENSPSKLTILGLTQFYISSFVSLFLGRDNLWKEGQTGLICPFAGQRLTSVSQICGMEEKTLADPALG